MQQLKSQSQKKICLQSTDTVIIPQADATSSDSNGTHSCEEFNGGEKCTRVLICYVVQGKNINGSRAIWHRWWCRDPGKKLQALVDVVCLTENAIECNPHFQCIQFSAFMGGLKCISWHNDASVKKKFSYSFLDPKFLDQNYCTEWPLHRLSERWMCSGYWKLGRNQLSSPGLRLLNSIVVSKHGVPFSYTKIP